MQINMKGNNLNKTENAASSGKTTTQMSEIHCKHCPAKMAKAYAEDLQRPRKEEIRFSSSFVMQDDDGGIFFKL